MAKRPHEDLITAVADKANEALKEQETLSVLDIEKYFKDVDRYTLSTALAQAVSRGLVGARYWKVDSIVFYENFKV